MSWRHAVPTGFTLGAMLAGFFSILMTASGNYFQAAQLIMLSMILDGLDGTMARLLKATTKIGSELDTFVDMCSFGLAPAVLVYQAVLKDFGVQGLLIASAVVLSGALRLSRFKVVDPHHGQRGYLGLPITVCAGWMTLFIFVSESGQMNHEWFSLHRGPVAVFVWACVLAFVVLQISHVRYVKPTKDPIALIPCVLLVGMLFFRVDFGVAAALTMCLYGFVYAFISPFHHRKNRVPAILDEVEDEEEEPVHVHH